MRRALSLIVVILLLSRVVSPQERPRPAFRVTAETVLVDVRVTDSKGRPVTGLTPEDFRITEEGIPQEITYFQEITLPAPATDRLATSRAANNVQLPPARTVASQNASKTAAQSTPSDRRSDFSIPAPDRRLLIILFNLSSLSSQDVAFMKESARKFINEELTPNDLVAVVLFDQSVQLLTDFTDDRQKLLGTLAALDEGDLERSEQASDSDETNSDQLGDYIVDETELDLFNTNRQLVAIQAVAEAFRDIPGRKSLIYFSGGLSLNDTETVEQVRQTTDVANRSNVSIYAVDARGLVAPSAGGGAQQAGGHGTSIFNGRQDMNALSSLAGSQEGMTTLAEDTGGRALLDDNESIKIFRAAQEDSSHYYLLGYVSANLVKDGKFRRIEVKTQRPGVKAEYRRGYYAEKPYIALTSAQKEQLLQQAVMEDRQAADFPAQVEAEYFPQPDGSYLVPTTVAFAYRDLRGPDPKSTSLDMDALVIARDFEGRVVTGVRDRVEVKASRSADADFNYQNLIRLLPGQFKVQVYLRDNRTGRMASAETPVALPPAQSLVFSSLAIGSALEDSKPMASSDVERVSGIRVKTAQTSVVVTSPLETAGKTLVPQTGAFHRPDPLFFQGTVLAKDLKKADFRVTIVHSTGRRVLASQWAPLESRASSPIWEYRGKVSIRALAPGEYQLEVEMRLDGTAKAVSRAFTVKD